MSSDRIKVVGYAKREFFGNGIEYRNFSPDLVGVQLTSDGGTPLFTMGNFSITTNMEPKSDKFFITNSFSNFITLTDLDLTLAQASNVLRNKSGVLLNLDKSKLNFYSLFGSLSEFMRVSLENIITTWPASLYMSETAFDSRGNILNGNTYEDYTYDEVNNVSSFKINTTFIDNKFQLNILKNGNIIDTFNSTNDLRNVTVYYSQYSVLFNNTEFPVLNFTGATYNTNDYVYFKVIGNPFSGLSTNNNIRYHIKPNKLKEETFFKELTDFESHLLNRSVTPKYTAEFKYSIKSEDGILLFINESVTWPTTDGYNIDFETSEYITYASKLVDISANNDLYTSDLMNRFLVSESISSFDTAPVNMDFGNDSSGQKMTKTLHIYGRNFDELNNYIEGISFANTVTYDKQNNIPDIYLKNLANVLGWELVSSIIENNLLSSYVTTAESTYSGQTVGLTAIEADVELWRRLILNTPWLWKSKGARKSIEFILNFIGVPAGLVTFNEYIYKADSPINMDLFRQTLVLNGLDDEDLSTYPIDSDGYPTPLSDNVDMYFQNYGLWYRETGGMNSDLDILTGNNPHLGPYDGGFKYINQFKGLIPNFSAVTITSETLTTNSTKLFTNYNVGEITNYSGDTYIEAVYDDGSDINECVVVTASIVNDPMPQTTTNDCGCDNTPNSDDALSLCVKVNGPAAPVLCNNVLSINDNATQGYADFIYYTYDMNGSIIYDSFGNPITFTSYFGTKTCCEANQGTPTIYNEVNPDGSIENTGYVCCKTQNCGCFIACKWLAYPKTHVINGEQYILFVKPDGQYAITTPDGSNCIQTYSNAVPNITDPFSNEIGFGCKLTPSGIADVSLGAAGIIYNFYLSRANGRKGCCEALI
jgi:hypothetical protein